jgi:hypothetical protein
MSPKPKEAIKTLISLKSYYFYIKIKLKIQFSLCGLYNYTKTTVNNSASLSRPRLVDYSLI